MQFEEVLAFRRGLYYLKVIIITHFSFLSLVSPFSFLSFLILFSSSKPFLTTSVTCLSGVAKISLQLAFVIGAHAYLLSVMPVLVHVPSKGVHKNTTNILLYIALAQANCYHFIIQHHLLLMGLKFENHRVQAD